jgi:hypothetical protein
MKKKQIIKLMSLASVPAIAITSIASITAFKISNTITANLSAVALSTVIANNTSIGTFKTPTPTKESILLAAKKIKSTFHAENQN